MQPIPLVAFLDDAGLEENDFLRDKVMPVTASLIWHEAPQFSGFGPVDFNFRKARQPSDISEANVPRRIDQIGIN